MTLFAKGQCSGLQKRCQEGCNSTPTPRGQSLLSLENPRSDNLISTDLCPNKLRGRTKRTWDKEKRHFNDWNQHTDQPIWTFSWQICMHKQCYTHTHTNSAHIYTHTSYTFICKHRPLKEAGARHLLSVPSASLRDFQQHTQLLWAPVPSQFTFCSIDKVLLVFLMQPRHHSYPQRACPTPVIRDIA